MKKLRWNFDQLGKLEQAVAEMGLAWDQIKRKYFSKLTIGQIKSAYYKLKRSENELCSGNKPVTCADQQKIQKIRQLQSGGALEDSEESSNDLKFIFE